VQAYAYLLYAHGKQLSEIAEKRLDAIRQFQDLSSGYKIALRDLELRGAGNLLGAEQSGTVTAVGFDLYLQLLEQAMRELKGEPDDAPIENPLPTVDLPVATAIPQTYIPVEAHRILMYKKLAAVRTREDVALLQEEMEDRFGSPPQPVWNALNILRLRLRCKELGIENIATEHGKAVITFTKAVRMPLHSVKTLNAAYKTVGLTATPEKTELRLPSATKILSGVEEMIEVLANALTAPPPPRKEANRFRQMKA
jgi:transcription-repair coupling factor (superfamily II helicase)